MFINSLIHFLSYVNNTVFFNKEQNLDFADINDEILYLTSSFLKINESENFENTDPVYYFEKILFDDDNFDMFLRFADFFSVFIVIFMFVFAFSIEKFTAALSVFDDTEYVFKKKYRNSRSKIRQMAQKSPIMSLVLSYFMNIMLALSKFFFAPSMIYILLTFFNNASVSSHQVVNIIYNPSKNYSGNNLAV